MALRFECDKCDVEVAPLFVAPNPVNGKTEQVMICPVCKDKFSVQSLPEGVDPDAPPPVAPLIPETAPDLVTIERPEINAEELRQNLLGRGARA